MHTVDTSATSTSLIIGASSEIGQALITQLLAEPTQTQIVAVSRNPLKLPPSVRTIICDYTPEAIANVGQELSTLAGSFERIVICNGILHSGAIQPEKRLEDLKLDNMAEVFRVNSIVPALWLQALAPSLRSTTVCPVVLLSARVGSISDNRAGGWYSYRASKAALNMLIQSAAIEFARRAKNVKLVAFHPGTVDTPLSAPFQGNIADGKLFTAAYVAKRMLAVVAQLPADGRASYLDYAGNTIGW